jgi:two-component system LytT family response regulator
MKNIPAIIIDDEATNIQLLKKMLEYNCPSVEIIATETDARKAISVLEELRPGLVFLDVEMPHLNGFDVLKKLEPLEFEVIFVTAYSHYAIEAFEHHAAGYITKPINAQKLAAAVQAALKRIKEKTVNKTLFTLLDQNHRLTQPDKIPLSTGNGLIFVKLADIIYCESSGNYTHFYLQDGRKNIVSRQLGEYEKLLPESHFIRIHDKYIINLAYIKEYKKGSGGEVLLENGRELPVSSRRKEDFLARFEKWIRRKL